MFSMLRKSLSGESQTSKDETTKHDVEVPEGAHAPTKKGKGPALETMHKQPMEPPVTPRKNRN